MEQRQSAHPHPKKASKPLPGGVVTDRSRRARSNLGRKLIPLTTVAMLLCAVVVWQRDSTAIEAEQSRMAVHAVPIEKFLRLHGSLPPHFPRPFSPDAENPHQKFHYLDSKMIAWAQTADIPAIIGYRQGYSLIIKPNGHAVLIYDKGNLRTEWMSSREFGHAMDEQRKAASNK